MSALQSACCNCYDSCGGGDFGSNIDDNSSNSRNNNNSGNNHRYRRGSGIMSSMGRFHGLCSMMVIERYSRDSRVIQSFRSMNRKKKRERKKERK